MRQLPVATKLPASFYREIGRITFYYSYFEHVLLQIAYAVLNINPKQGRIAVRELRGPDQVRLLRDLISVSEAKVGGSFDYFETLAKSVNSQRDLLAHGVWVKDGSTFKIMRTRGSRSIAGEKMPRSIKPEGVHHDLDSLKYITGEALELCNLALDMLESVAPSEFGPKSKKQFPRMGRSPNHSA